MRQEPHGASILMHHVVLGIEREVRIDHRNGNGLDNRKVNLRPCTHSQNLQNQRKRKDNTSGYKGVAWHPGARKWYAYIQVEKKRLHLGLFANPVEAAQAYDAAARLHFGEFARPNFT